MAFHARVLRRGVVILAAAGALIVSRSGLATEAIGVQAAETGSPNVGHAAEFRAFSGFRSDIDFVKGTFEDPRYSAEDWGIPLSDSELAELARRVEVQASTGPVLDTAVTVPGFAGSYFDLPAGSVPVFLTAGDPTEFEIGLSSMIPRDLVYRIERVDLTMDQLLGQKARMSEELLIDHALGDAIWSVGIDTPANGITVDADLADGLLQALRDRYGPNVSVHEEPRPELDACTDREHCLPLKGGIEIYHHGHEADGDICTAGILVYESNVDRYGLLTAGHCIGLGGGIGAIWDHNGTSWGVAKYSTWASNANADTGVIRIDTADVPTATQGRNLFYATSPADVRQFTSAKSTSQQTYASYVCRSGWRSGSQCGNIIVVDGDFVVEGLPIHHQWKVNTDTCGGDSGGPYFLYNGIWGTVTDSAHDDGAGCDINTGNGWYSPIVWSTTTLAQAGHPVGLCVTLPC
jgi:hypothetical protein